VESFEHSSEPSGSPKYGLFLGQKKNNNNADNIRTTEHSDAFA